MMCGSCGFANPDLATSCKRCGATLTPKTGSGTQALGSPHPAGAGWNPNAQPLPPGSVDAARRGGVPPTAAIPSPMMPPASFASQPGMGGPPGVASRPGFGAPNAQGTGAAPSQPPPRFSSPGSQPPGPMPAGPAPGFSAQAAQPQKAAPPKKGGSGLLIGVVVLLLFALVGGGLAGYFLVFLPQQEDEDEAVAQAEAAAANAEPVAAVEPAPVEPTPVAPPPEPVPEPAPAAEPPPAPVPEPAPVVAPPPAPAPAPVVAQPPAPAPAPPVAQPPAPAPVVAQPPVAPRPQSIEARVRAAVRQASRQCYMVNAAHGAVMVQVSIGSDGRVTASRVLNNGTMNSAVASCISAALVGRRVDPVGPPGGVTLSVQFSG